MLVLKKKKKQVCTEAEVDMCEYLWKNFFRPTVKNEFSANHSANSKKLGAELKVTLHTRKIQEYHDAPKSKYSEH